MYELPTVRIIAPSQPPTQQTSPAIVDDHQHQLHHQQQQTQQTQHIGPKFGMAVISNNNHNIHNTNTTTTSTTTTKLKTAETNEYLLCSIMAAGTNMDHATNTHSQQNISNTTTSNINNHHLNKVSQLKESHSALVKILESAPINGRHSRVSTAASQTRHRRASNETSSSSSSSSSPSSPLLSTAASHGLHHRKRSKHLYRTSAHQDDLNESVKSAWHFPRGRNGLDCHDDAESNGNSNKTEMTDVIEIHEWQQHDHSMDEEDDSNSQCECYNTWRRSSSDSNESIQNNDSGCDSDCPENITELCKKFDENLSEQDVIIVEEKKINQSISL